MMLRWVSPAGALVGFLAGAFPLEAGVVFAQDLREETRRGAGLTAAGAAALEERLTANPEDVVARARLLGYTSRLARQRRPGHGHTEHLLWFIRNRPEDDLLEGGAAQVLPLFDPDGYAAVKRAWLRLVEEEPDNAVFVRRTCVFLRSPDARLAETLLERGEALEPSNPWWARQLGRTRWRRASRAGAEPDQVAAAEVLAHLERAHALSEERGARNLLAEMSRAALAAGETGKARAHANALLEPAPNDPNRGDRLHSAHLLLGRAALAEGDAQGAAAHLLAAGEAAKGASAAGEAPATLRLAIRLPDLSLARDLLAAGDRESVLRYLQLCLEFHETYRDRIEDWIVLVEAGLTPDFRRRW